MNWVRLFILSACLGATGWYLEQEQRAARFQRVDDFFLDFLVANARDRLTQSESGQGNPVVLVSLRAEQKSEYASWPVPPLDWQTILKGLHPFEPSVIVIPDPLFWGSPAPEFVPAVSEALLPFNGVVLGVEAQLSQGSQATTPFMGGIEDHLPQFQRVDGPLDSAPSLSALVSAPDSKLRVQSELGIAAVTMEGGLPYALRVEEKLMPSVLAQALARYSNSPYAYHRLRLGPGAAAYLGQGLFVPLEIDGTVKSQDDKKVATVNALDLMTGGLADGLSVADQAMLGKGKIIVIGSDHQVTGQAPSIARMHAAALTHLLSLPRLQRLSQIQQWLICGLAALSAFWIVFRVRRSRALHAGIALIFTALVVSFLVFQSYFLWCPPTLPAALIGVGAVVGFIFGRGQSQQPTLESPSASQ
jgi:hypothetical protein